MASIFGIIACIATFFAATQMSSGQAESYVRGCYYTNWAQYRPDKGKYTPENYVPGLCTHIFFAFVIMDNNYQLKAFEWNDEDTDWSLGTYHKIVNLKQQQPDLKVILSFGGWTFSQGNAGLLFNMASTASNRATFINSVVKFVRRINFDGFDIDWEYPEARDKANYATLVKEMREAFDKEAKESGKPRLILTAAVAAGVSKIDAGYDGPLLGQYFDYVNIMSYDFHGGWETQTGFNSPLFDRQNDQMAVAVAAEHWSKVGVPKSKLLVGLGTYGRGWTLASAGNSGVGAPTSGVCPQLPYSREAGIATYYEICNLIDKEGYQEFYDEKQQAPYVVGGPSKNVWIGYDNVKSFNAKLDWIKQNGFGGAFIWALDMDDFQGQCASSHGQKYPLMSAINAKLGGGAAPPAPPAPQPQPTAGPKPTQPQPPKPTEAPQSKPTQPPQPKPAPQPTQQPQKPGGPFKCSGAGIFADPESCQWYYNCDSNNIANRMPCPGGLDFNDSSKTCDWPANAKCSRN